MYIYIYIHTHTQYTHTHTHARTHACTHTTFIQQRHIQLKKYIYLYLKKS